MIEEFEQLVFQFRVAIREGKAVQWLEEHGSRYEELRTKFMVDRNRVLADYCEAVDCKLDTLHKTNVSYATWDVPIGK